MVIASDSGPVFSKLLEGRMEVALVESYEELVEKVIPFLPHVTV